MNWFDWPMKRPSSVRAFTAPMAAPVVSVGRMIEHGGKLAAEERGGLGHDQVGLEILAAERWRVEIGERDGDAGYGVDHIVSGRTLPALSCQVWKWQISVPPMLSRMRRTSTLLARWASIG